MDKTSSRLIMIVMVLLLASLACQAIGGGSEQPQTPVEQPNPTSPTVPEELTPLATHAPAESTQPEKPVQSSPPAAKPPAHDTKFPLPEDVQQFTKLDNGQINFQTNMNQEDVIAFYRDAFQAQGLNERQLLTVIDESVFSMVFDGAPNGQSVVIQGVTLSPGLVNVNIRLEDV